MLRKTTCAAVGIALACAAGYSLTAHSETFSDLDLRWFHTSAKQDRLPVRSPVIDRGTAVAIDLESQSMTIVTKAPAAPIVESAVRTPRTNSVRTIQVHPVREVPNEEANKKRLPEGCEPAFSPVTNPAYAHIGVRCDS